MLGISQYKIETRDAVQIAEENNLIYTKRNNSGRQIKFFQFLMH